MLHHIDPDQLQSLQGFNALFSGLAESHFKINESNGFHGFHTLFEHADYSSGKKVIINGESFHSSWITAKLAAMGEAVERYAFQQATIDITNASYQNLQALGRSCLDPNSYQIFAREQNAVIDEMALNLSRQTAIDWIWFEDGLNQGKQILLPSHFGQFTQMQAPVYFLSSTSGNACHLSLARAKLNASLEILERDAFLFYWWTRNAPIPLEFPIDDIAIANQQFLKKISLFYLRTDFDIPVIAAVFRSDRKRQEPAFLFSAACHLHPLQAIHRAVSELIQVFIWQQKKQDDFAEVNYSPDFEATVWGFSDHVSLYAQSPPANACDFLFSQSSKKTRWQDLPIHKHHNEEKNLAFVLNEFRRTGHRLYFKDLTTQKIKNARFTVIRAFSPDLIAIDFAHRFRPLGYERLYQLGNTLGLKRQPNSFADLNPFPHPFP